MLPQLGQQQTQEPRVPENVSEERVATGNPEDALQGHKGTQRLRAVLDQALHLPQDLMGHVTQLEHQGLQHLEEVPLHQGWLQGHDLHELRDGLQGPLQEEEVAGIPGPHGPDARQDFGAEDRVADFVENILQDLKGLKILHSHP